MLVLLIIFIITVPVMKHSVNVELPRAANQPEVVQPSTVRLSVAADGRYFLNGTPVSDDALPALLQAEAPGGRSPTCTSAATARCATSAWPRPWRWRSARA